MSRSLAVMFIALAKEETVSDTVPSIRLPLETLTPLFLGGADPRGDPELRASSVRGALRFWLRALLGGCYGT
ncbi:type III-B CRISPR module RAMP protein Cmr1, partial [Thermomicrobium sp.]